MRREIAKLCLELRSPDERSDIRDGVRVVPDVAALIRATGCLKIEPGDDARRPANYFGCSFSAAELMQ